MSFEHHVIAVLRAIPERVRDDVCMLGVWVTAERTAVIGWNTTTRLEANDTAWEWSQWRFECPRALVVDPAPPIEELEAVLQAMHRDGGIVAVLGHAVALIVDSELAPCSA